MSLRSAQVVASAARTTTGNGTAQQASDARLGILVACTAASGTAPTLDVVVQWSADGTNFYAAQAADSFTQITAASGAAKVFDVKAPLYRIAWTIGGTTPSFTFSVDVVSYA